MNKLKLFSLVTGGVVLLLTGATAQADPFTRNSTQVNSPNAFSAPLDKEVPDRLIEMFMAENQVGLVEKVMTLEGTLGEAENELDDADLTLHQTSIDAAGALISVVDAEQSFEHSKTVFNIAKEEHAEAKRELKTLQSLPVSQENNVEINELKREIVRLRDNFLAARADRVTAKSNLRLARSNAALSEHRIGVAQNAVDEAKQKIAALAVQIEVAHLAFDKEQEEVKVLVSELSAEQLYAFNHSLDKAMTDDLLFLNIGTEHLKVALEDAYNKQQIGLLAKALGTEALLRQAAADTGNKKLLIEAAQKKEKILAKIDQIEAEKLDAERNGKSAFGIASHPQKKTKKPSHSR